MFNLRDRLLANRGFQRFAAQFPLTRPIARRRTRALFDLCAGFVYSQVLFACVELNLLEILAERPQTSGELAKRLSLTPEASERLLRAATALGLAQRRLGNRFGLGSHGAAMMGNPGIAAMVEHHKMLYADLFDPVSLLRGDLDKTRLADYWPYAAYDNPGGLATDKVRAFTELMSASQPMISSEVLGAYNFARHRCLLDVGGGDGSFVRAVAERTPDLRIMLFDLPGVADQARDRLQAAGCADRVTVVEGDFFTDSLPQGADIVSLVRIIHDHDDRGALAILRAVRQALPSDGRLLLAEPMSGTAGAETVADAYFGFYLLAMGRGRARTLAELSTLLREAGFDEIRTIPTRIPMLTSVVLAQP